MAAQPYPMGTFPIQFFGGGIKRSMFVPNAGGPGGGFKAGGAVFAGGTLQNNALFDSTFGTLNYPYMGIHNGYNENKPYNGLSLDQNSLCITKPLSAGSFATMTKGQYIMLTFSSQIAGTANTLLNSPAAAYGRKSQNVNIGWVDTVQINKTGGFYMYNGLPVNPLNSRDNIKTETYPGTYSIPGRLTWMSTGVTAKTQSYAAKSD